LVDSYPENEQKTFSKQEAEATAFTADPASHIPMIDALAAYRGMDVAELAARILLKAEAFATYSGAVIGHRQWLEDAINAVETQDELDLIDPASGWPE
jgi:hypothetical protein